MANTDILGLVVTIGFITAGFSVIPLDRWLERRRLRRIRNQAHRPNAVRARRAAARWVRS